MGTSLKASSGVHDFKFRSEMRFRKCVFNPIKRSLTFLNDYGTFDVMQQCSKIDVIVIPQITICCLCSCVITSVTVIKNENLERVVRSCLSRNLGNKGAHHKPHGSSAFKHSMETLGETQLLSTHHYQTGMMGAHVGMKSTEQNDFFAQ